MCHVPPFNLLVQNFKFWRTFNISWPCCPIAQLAKDTSKAIQIPPDLLCLFCCHFLPLDRTLNQLFVLQLEPVYDNMGPRTTADGSSVLSLNKTGLEASPVRHVSTLPRPGHSHHAALAPSPLPAYYSPLEERVNGLGLPRHATASPALPVSASASSPSSAKLERNGRRGSWSRISPESTSMTTPRPVDDVLLMPGSIKRPSSLASVTSASSTTPLTNGSAGGVRTVKVPPKPPPKPKKKVGPLFEDEGEDGTEV